ncbi:MAG: deoxyribose-phosphate aldolase [Myxococcota bacterium]
MHPLARRIEHTLLRPTATADDIARLCDEAAEHHFHAVCVSGRWVQAAAERLASTDVSACTVVGFPLGATHTAIKVFETELAIVHGAREIDMVLDLGALLGGDLDGARQDVSAVVAAAESEVPVKVILETGYLSSEQIETACAVVRDAGAAFVKTSTGFGPRGASVDDVRTMKRVVGDALGIKAAGGIRTVADAEAMVEAGADRLGTSAGVALVGGA